MNMSEILAVSSGTLGSLTGLRTTAAIEIVIDHWVDYELEHDTPGDNWYQSWHDFRASDSYPHHVVDVPPCTLQSDSDTINPDRPQFGMAECTPHVHMFSDTQEDLPLFSHGG